MLKGSFNKSVIWLTINVINLTSVKHLSRISMNELMELQVFLSVAAGLAHSKPNGLSIFDWTKRIGAKFKIYKE